MRLVRTTMCVLLAFCMQIAVAQSEPKLEHFDPNFVDRSVEPCNDFYQFACGKWEAANPIPPDQVAWGTDSRLQLYNETVLREALEAAGEGGAKRSPVDQKIGDYYKACMDEQGINAAGLRDLKPELARIAKIEQKAGLIDEIAHLHMTLPGAPQFSDNQTDAAFFGFGSLQDFDDASKVVAAFDQGGMSLFGRDYYLKDDAKSVELRAKYVAHITKMLTLSGEKPAQAAADARIVLELETAIAKAAMDNVSRRDPKNLNNRMTLEQAQGLAPTLNFKRYVELVRSPAPDHYLVLTPQFFTALEQLLQQHSLEQWKAYLRWQLVHYSAPYLNRDLVDENFNFFRHTLAGAQEQLPRWRRCVRAADRDLGEALGQAYVNRAFPGDSKTAAVELVRAVEAALQQDIDSLDWMAPATKKEAARKLQAIEDKIGYPNKWRDYSSVRIVPNSYLVNIHEATAFEFKRVLSKIGQPVDRSEWLMTPPTINAYYDAQLNTINFPAGILQPPFFSKDMDDAANFGGIGAVIGHEIIHGFDDQGRKFDAAGNLRDWWTTADAKAYDERGECISDQYTQEVPEAGVKQDGKLTQGEDTADNGGTRLALAALEHKLRSDGKQLDAKDQDGWTAQQRFFISYGFSWCTQVRPEAARIRVLTNPHSLARYRVNNVVSNMPEFQQAFSCKKGTPMVRANACRVW
ncbi:MAG TPA: M13 family metallopeptidase [Steroidobacteraceae bacterium]|nr:M13 family metallopeptidase [Steroidobacteraceae bacterium]